MKTFAFSILLAGALAAQIVPNPTQSLASAGRGERYAAAHFPRDGHVSHH